MGCFRSLKAQVQMVSSAIAFSSLGYASEFSDQKTKKIL